MRSIGIPELLLIAAILVFLFGGKKLAEVGTGLGKGIRNFKDALKDGQQEGTPPSSPSPPPDAGKK